jgi:hypothetical protein
MAHALESSLLMGVSQRMNADWIVFVMRSGWREMLGNSVLSQDYSETCEVESPEAR